MSKLTKKIKQPLLVAATLSATLLLSSGFKNHSSFLVDDGDPIYGVTNLVNITYASLDAETESYIPSNRVYNRYDALALRDNLQKQYEANPSSLAINFALVKFHANAPNFSGGYKGMALQYAANIYRLNSYVGCLVYEYIYTKNYDFKNAERWYKNSLISRLSDGFEWREVKFVENAPFGVAVVGPFSNGHPQPLYQNIWGSYTRKIMVPKCNNDCLFTLVPDFLKGSKQVKGEIVFTNW
ncbi:MAG: hypothetical protein ACOVO1_10950 [Chitinophagaceae bacterium]